MDKHDIYMTPELVEDLINVYGTEDLQRGLFFSVNTTEKINSQPQYIFDTYATQKVQVVGLFPSTGYLVKIVVLCDEFTGPKRLSITGTKEEEEDGNLVLTFEEK